MTDGQLRKVGILGGSFDPPHLGHLAIAHAARVSLNLSEVILLPAFRNPLKSVRTAPAEQRLEMVRLLAEGQENLAVSDIEITRGGLSYSVDTVSELQYVSPAQYWLILGSDALKELGHWKSPDRLLKLSRLAVVNRDSRKEFAFPVGFPEEWQAFVDFVPMSAHPASSTEIRERLAMRRDISAFTPPSVISYIREHRLYQP